MTEPVSVMKQIEQLEQAREDYARDKFRGAVERKLMTSSSSNINDVIAREIKPRVGLLIGNEHHEELQGYADAISDDIEIAEDSIEATWQRYTDVLAQATSTAIEDIEQAYCSAVHKLQDASNPFEDSGAMMAYMTELNLLGGAGGTKKEIVERASKAIESGEPGALQFWQRNFKTLLNRAGGESGSAKSWRALNEVEQQIRQAVVSKMSQEQRVSHNRLTALTTAWESQKIDSEITIGKSAARRVSKSTTHSTIKPRGRTEVEKTKAMHRARLRAAEAGLRAAGEQPHETRGKVRVAGR